MKNKANFIGLIILVSLGTFLGIAAISETSKQLGTIVEYPVKQMMNPTEEKILEGLFSGDTIARVKLVETGKIIPVVFPAEYISPIGTPVRISNFLNGETYRVVEIVK